MTFELDLTQIAVAVVTAIVPVVAAFVVQLLRAKIQAVQATMSSDDWAYIEQVAAIAVRAAEQVYGAGKGDEKKASAIAAVQSALTTRGIAMDVTAVEAAIEAAVFDASNGFQFADAGLSEVR